MSRVLGPETAKSHMDRHKCWVIGFYQHYMQGIGLDIGYKGSMPDVLPVLPSAIGIDHDYPGYDGVWLPFGDQTQDYVFSSHCLEHIPNYDTALQEWFRVLKVGGYLIVIVPHKWLYEKKEILPSRWNSDHKRYYPPSAVLQEIEESLEPNTWRLRHMRDNDDGYDYAIGPDQHPTGCYEIECVIQKIQPPTWEIK